MSKKTLTINCLDNSVFIDIETPSRCPHCGRMMEPRHLMETTSDNHSLDDAIRFGVVFQCVYDDCSNYFIQEYEKLDTELIAFQYEYHYRPQIDVELPKNIEVVSPDFVNIYKQSVRAESEGLDLICGVGYRKAAEFLIKDYVISKNESESETIKKIALGKVIDGYLKDMPKIQVLAKSVAWIGNDETHYVRKHNDRDLQDLKRFIYSTAQFIAADYDADEALSFTSNN
ncbi:DUF4145 domain-containing protein [Streptococcus danieliae]|nr:DUF4145 domain-containing protein [Streptococcus danieliae]